MAEIIYKGEALPVHLGMRALNQLSTDINVDFATILSGFKADDASESFTNAAKALNFMCGLTVVGLNLGAEKQRLEVRYTEAEVWDMFDDEPHIIQDMMGLFEQSLRVLTDNLGEIVPKKA